MNTVSIKLFFLGWGFFFINAPVYASVCDSPQKIAAALNSLRTQQLCRLDKDMSLCTQQLDSAPAGSIGASLAAATLGAPIKLGDKVTVVTSEKLVEKQINEIVEVELEIVKGQKESRLLQIVGQYKDPQGRTVVQYVDLRTGGAVQIDPRSIKTISSQDPAKVAARLQIEISSIWKKIVSRDPSDWKANGQFIFRNEEAPALMGRISALVRMGVINEAKAKALQVGAAEISRLTGEANRIIAQAKDIDPAKMGEILEKWTSRLRGMIDEVMPPGDAKLLPSASVAIAKIKAVPWATAFKKPSELAGKLWSPTKAVGRNAFKSVLALAFVGGSLFKAGTATAAGYTEEAKVHLQEAGKNSISVIPVIGTAAGLALAGTEIARGPICQTKGRSPYLDYEPGSCASSSDLNGPNFQNLLYAVPIPTKLDPESCQYLDRVYERYNPKTETSCQGSLIQLSLAEENKPGPLRTTGDRLDIVRLSGERYAVGNTMSPGREEMVFDNSGKFLGFCASKMELFKNRTCSKLNSVSLVTDAESYEGLRVQPSLLRKPVLDALSGVEAFKPAIVAALKCCDGGGGTCKKVSPSKNSGARDAEY